MNTSYDIQTSRLGLRNWHQNDIEAIYRVSSDANVMEYFPSLWNERDAVSFVKRMQEHYQNHGFCYFAVDLLDTKECIGFIGLLNQTYASPFTPCVDIGWRLGKNFWGKGYATEGAKACLNFGFEKMNLNKIYSVASVINTRSTHVMKKIGMEKVLTFDHPKILDYPKIKTCDVYLTEKA